MSSDSRKNWKYVSDGQNPLITSGRHWRGYPRPQFVRGFSETVTGSSFFKYWDIRRKMQRSQPDTKSTAGSGRVGGDGTPDQRQSRVCFWGETSRDTRRTDMRLHLADPQRVFLGWGLHSCGLAGPELPSLQTLLWFTGSTASVCRKGKETDGHQSSGQATPLALT